MNLFGTDGIRGIANAGLSWQTAFRLGRAMGLHLSQGLPLCVGKDTRASGDMLEASIVAGATSAGRDVVRLGVVTTPGLSFLVKHLGLGGGVMISASHNPAEYNGLKVFGADGKKIPDSLEILFSEFILGDSDSAVEGATYPTGSGIGRVIAGEGYVDKYVDFLFSIPANRFSGLRVVLDTANGSTSNIAPRVWSRLGAQVEVMNNSPDGTNINADCGSTCPGKVAARVAKSGAHAGFAYDGDGDRCIMVDETGTVQDGDHIMAILALDLNSKGRLPGGTVVGTVMSNYGLEVCLSNENLRLERTPVGDRYVLEKMEEKGYNLGGEQSGHIIVKDVLGAGDGILTSLMVADVLAGSGKRLSQLASVMTAIPQHLVNVKAAHPKELAARDTVASAVRRVQAELGDRGRVLVRPSGTEPLVRIMVESLDSHMVQSCIHYLEEVIAKENEAGRE
ncbi:MAG: phosphoglucosamine mutase [Bacillota bacterium]